MALLDSLPARPLTPAEVAGLNRADAFDVAVPVGEARDPDDSAAEADGDAAAADDGSRNGLDGPTDALLLATGDWVKGLAFAADDGGWRVVETVSLDARSVERFDALRSCEEAVRFHHPPESGTDSGADPDGDGPETA